MSKDVIRAFALAARRRLHRCRGELIERFACKPRYGIESETL
jgi:hypothetical protein